MHALKFGLNKRLFSRLKVIRKYCDKQVLSFFIGMPGELDTSIVRMQLLLSVRFKNKIHTAILLQCIDPELVKLCESVADCSLQWYTFESYEILENHYNVLIIISN